MPRIASECARASSSSRAILIPPALPRLPIAHLCLDHARVADLVRRRHGVVDGRGVTPFGDRNAVLGEELLALIFE